MLLSVGHLGFSTVALHCHTDVALQRNSRRLHSIPATTLKNMATQFEQPDPCKHQWERHSLVLESSSWEESEGCDKVWYAYSSVVH